MNPVKKKVIALFWLPGNSKLINKPNPVIVKTELIIRYTAIKSFISLIFFSKRVSISKKLRENMFLKIDRPLWR